MEYLVQVNGEIVFEGSYGRACEMYDTWKGKHFEVYLICISPGNAGLKKSYKPKGSDD